MSDTKVFDEHDIHELDELLSALKGEDVLRLDAAQGLMAAISVGPREVDEAHWMAAIVADAEMSPGYENEFQRLQSLLRALKEAVEYSIEHFAFDAIFSEVRDQNGDHHVDAGGWCEGFSVGIDLQADIWEAQMQFDDELIALLSPIMALGVDDGVFSEIKDPHITPLSEAEREDLMQRLPQVLAEVRHYWDEAEAAPKARSARQLH